MAHDYTLLCYMYIVNRVKQKDCSPALFLPLLDANARPHQLHWDSQKTLRFNVGILLLYFPGGSRLQGDHLPQGRAGQGQQGQETLPFRIPGLTNTHR